MYSSCSLSIVAGVELVELSVTGNSMLRLSIGRSLLDVDFFTFGLLLMSSSKRSLHELVSEAFIFLKTKKSKTDENMNESPIFALTEPIYNEFISANGYNIEWKIIETSTILNVPRFQTNKRGIILLELIFHFLK